MNIGSGHREQENPAMQLLPVKIDKPETTNFILGQTHFIKIVEDVHEALIQQSTWFCRS
jgi:adenosine/AMP kinase